MPASAAAPTAGSGAAAKRPPDNKKKLNAKHEPAGDPTIAARGGYAAMPPDARLAIQSNLAWLGYYAGPPGGEFDDRTIAAVKAFQQANHIKETGLLDPDQRARLAAAAPARQRAVDWRVVDDPATGARFGVPGKLVARVGDLPTGSAYRSGQGQIQIETFGLSEASLQALFEAEKRSPRDRYVAASTLKPDSFVISGTQGLKYFVERAEANAGKVRGITVLYDQATIGTMAPLAVAVANSFVGFPTVAAPSAKQGTVEYGTAVVADGSGDLITSAAVTEGCTAIAVPGFGYAARLDADPALKVALLRLYGAHDLVPAGLAEEPLAESADLVLFGVADPRVQNGGAAVTKAPARLAHTLITPVPQSGFAGAAAVDAQGRFAGLVDVEPAAGSEPPAAVLVGAGSVHGFLAAHGIAASAARGTTERSVLRVICLRNERDAR